MSDDLMKQAPGRDISEFAQYATPQDISELAKYTTDAGEIIALFVVKFGPKYNWVSYFKNDEGGKVMLTEKGEPEIVKRYELVREERLNKEGRAYLERRLISRANKVIALNDFPPHIIERQLGDFDIGLAFHLHANHQRYGLSKGDIDDIVDDCCAVVQGMYMKSLKEGERKFLRYTTAEQKRVVTMPDQKKSGWFSWGKK